MAASFDAPSIERRPILAEDEGFLRELFASTREQLIGALGLPPTQQEAFLRFQFDAQQRHCAEANPQGRFEIVLVNGQQAGRLCVDVRPDTMYIVDISLLPRFRGQGIGTRLLCDAIREGALDRRSASLHVAADSPARRLYARLGFEPAREDGAHLLMERPARLLPDQAKTAS